MKKAWYHQRFTPKSSVKCGCFLCSSHSTLTPFNLGNVLIIDVCNTIHFIVFVLLQLLLHSWLILLTDNDAISTPNYTSGWCLSVVVFNLIPRLLHLLTPASLWPTSSYLICCYTFLWLGRQSQASHIARTTPSYSMGNYKSSVIFSLDQF